MNQDFEIKNNILIKYHGTGGAVIIPENITEIGERAFYKCKNLISVTLPDSVTCIGYSAFMECSALRSVIIPDTVTNIRDFAFWDCSSLISVQIPRSITTIREAVFWGCTSLISVNIPDHVTSIRDCAFCRCSGLKSVRIPDSVTSIGEDAFKGCTSLKHAPLMLIEGKMLYEPPKRNNTEFPQIREFVECRDYSMEMNFDVKYNLIFQMYALGLDEEETFAYISENFSAMSPVLINMDDIELIQKILDSEKIITKENIDEFIRCAIDQKKYQIQIMLTDYKNQKNWYQDIDKKFKL